MTRHNLETENKLIVKKIVAQANRSAAIWARSKSDSSNMYWGGYNAACNYILRYIENDFQPTHRKRPKEGKM